METQNSYTNTDKIQENMDKMAIALAEAELAWKKIFIKPLAKNWTDVIVALKINAIESKHPLVVIIHKLCTELINCGVSAENTMFLNEATTSIFCIDTVIKYYSSATF